MESDINIRVFDSTLRDGEQSPGATMNEIEKLLVASQLEKLGVDVIEAGFPAASAGELQAVRRIAQTVQDCTVAALCRTCELDIESAWEAIRHARSPMFHVFIATSDLHLEHKLKMTRDEVLEEIRRSVSSCRALCDQVEFSAEDATRSDSGFLAEACACAMEAGATVLNIPDTVGYTMPQEYETIIGSVVELVGDRPIVVSAHCHNDLGVAVANSLAAVRAGARQVECCVNGIGERAGNAALEEIVMAFQVRHDLLGCTTNVDTTRLHGTSRLVCDITGLPIQRNKAIVGRNAFAHEAGVHQHALLADKRTYEIMRPEDVGVPESTIVLGKHSGRAALRDRLVSHGYDLDRDQLDRVFTAFKSLADRKKHVYEEDLHALVGNQLLDGAERFRLEDVEFRSGSTTTPWARAVVSVDGEPHTAECTGDGPVNAAIQAIKQCTDKRNTVLGDYQITAVTEGSDALGRVTLSVSEGGLAARGQASHSDVVAASAEAYVKALNQLAVQRRIRDQGVT